MTSKPEPPLIVTLDFDERSRATFETLRRRHFPPERNFIPAHLTLFHHLPSGEEAEIMHVLADIARRTPRMPLEAVGLRFLGRGVAFDIAGGACAALRADLARVWSDWLTPQDRQSFRPHVTIQNKASPEAAKALHAALSADFQPFAVEGSGLLLWRYLGGPWEARGSFSFSG